MMRCGSVSLLSHHAITSSTRRRARQSVGICARPISSRRRISDSKNAAATIDDQNRSKIHRVAVMVEAAVDFADVGCRIRIARINHPPPSRIGQPMPSK